MPAAVAAQTTPPASPALPQRDDLTLADGAGNVLIGLTVRPAQPGPNTVLVHVLPLEGAAAAADVSVSVVINGQPVPLDFCSRTCRTADVTLAGSEHVDVVADSTSGGTAGFNLPALPAPDASILLQQMQERMHRLRTFRSDELMTPAATPRATHATIGPARPGKRRTQGSPCPFRPSCGISAPRPLRRSWPPTSSVLKMSMVPVRRCWRSSKTSDRSIRSGSASGRMPTGWSTRRRCADRATSWTSTTPTS